MIKKNYFFFSFFRLLPYWEVFWFLDLLWPLSSFLFLVISVCGNASFQPEVWTTGLPVQTTIQLRIPLDTMWKVTPLLQRRNTILPRPIRTWYQDLKVGWFFISKLLNWPDFEKVWNIVTLCHYNSVKKFFEKWNVFPMRRCSILVHFFTFPFFIRLRWFSFSKSLTFLEYVSGSM